MKLDCFTQIEGICTIKNEDGTLKKDRCGGTGYLISPTQVLTARHVIQDVSSLVIRYDPPGRDTWIQRPVCKVLWEGSEEFCDVALLELEEEALVEVPKPWVAPPAWKRRIRWETRGWPTISPKHKARVCDSFVSMSGTVAPVAGNEQRLQLTIDQSAGEISDWQGSSGAPVFDDHGRLLGVIADTPMKKEEKGKGVSTKNILTAVPLRSFIDDEGFLEHMGSEWFEPRINKRLWTVATLIALIVGLAIYFSQLLESGPEPSHPEAQRLYHKGMEAFTDKHNFLAARAAFIEALHHQEHPVLYLFYARASWALNERREAERAAGKALQLTDGLAEVHRLQVQAGCYAILGQYEDALKALTALSELQPNPNDLDIGLTEAEIRSLAVSSEQADGVIAGYLVDASKSSVGHARLAEAWLLFDQGENKKAIDSAKQAAAAGRGMDTPTLEARALLVQGMAYERSGDYSKAIAALKTALDIYKRLGSLSGQVDVYQQMALTEVKQEQWAKALKALQSALKLFDTPGADQLEVYKAWVQVSFGKYHSDYGELTRARKYFHEAVTVLEEHDEELMAAEAEFNLAVADHHEGNLDKAEKGYRENMAVFEEFDDFENVARAITNLAEISLDTGDPCKAKEGFVKALDMANGKYRDIEEHIGPLLAEAREKCDSP